MQPEKPTILLAEDDVNLSFVIADQLTGEGYEVVKAMNGERAFEVFDSISFQLCIIDVMMPRMDGFSLAEKIRAKDEMVPIIFLTARSQEEDKLKGFSIGGDDYVTKPFSIQELLQRIKVFLRRPLKTAPVQSAIISIGEYEFDKRNLTLSHSEKEIQLTQMEAQLLALLSKNLNKLVNREEILEAVWGENDYFKGRSLDVFISRLRKYLHHDPSLEIRNHHGIGFSLIDGNFSG